MEEDINVESDDETTSIDFGYQIIGSENKNFNIKVEQQSQVMETEQEVDLDETFSYHDESDEDCNDILDNILANQMSELSHATCISNESGFLMNQNLFFQGGNEFDSASAFDMETSIILKDGVNMDGQNTTVTSDGDRNKVLKTSDKSERPKNQDIDYSSNEFYFESDHLALRNNDDYLKLIKALVILQSQKIQAVKDMERLLVLQKESKEDPLEFVRRLQKQEVLDVTGPQKITEVPSIDWAKYRQYLNVTTYRPLTRKVASGEMPAEAVAVSSSQSSYMSKEDLLDEVMKVRGRVFDQSKPETFNQLWTSEEQRRLEELLNTYPPEEVEMRRWEKIARDLGNRSAIQVQSRVQKYFVKLQKAGLPVPKWKKRHNIMQRRLKSGSAHPILYRPSTFFGHVNYLDNSNNMDSTSITVVDSINKTQVTILERIRNEMTVDRGKTHPGIQCASCGEDPLQGVRWHCLQCDNCDFCSSCLAQLGTVQAHWDHVLQPLHSLDIRL